VLGVLILFLSSSLIANTLSALLSQHLRHIGVMKLVGGRRSQIFTMYIVLILAFGVIALLIAVPLGGQGAYALSAYIANMINFNLLGYRIIPLAFAIQIVVGLAVPLLAGLGPVLNGSQITCCAPSMAICSRSKRNTPCLPNRASRLSSVSRSGSPPGFPGAGCISHAHC